MEINFYPKRVYFSHDNRARPRVWPTTTNCQFQCSSDFFFLSWILLWADSIVRSNVLMCLRTFCFFFLCEAVLLLASRRCGFKLNRIGDRNDERKYSSHCVWNSMRARATAIKQIYLRFCVFDNLMLITGRERSRDNRMHVVPFNTHCTMLLATGNIYRCWRIAERAVWCNRRRTRLLERLNKVGIAPSKTTTTTIGVRIRVTCASVCDRPIDCIDFLFRIAKRNVRPRAHHSPFVESCARRIQVDFFVYSKLL